MSKCPLLAIANNVVKHAPKIWVEVSFGFEMEVIEPRVEEINAGSCP